LTYIHRLNQAIDQFEPTIHLLYRAAVTLAIIYDAVQDTSCKAPRFSS